MYIEFVMFAAFVFFAILDVRRRQIKLYWFVILASFVVGYRLIFEFQQMQSDLLLFVVSFIFLLIAYACRLFAKADFVAMAILIFAVPSIGPIPAGIPVIFFTLYISYWAIILSNLKYNISDLINHIALFDDIDQSQQKKIKKIYWFLLARRRRDNDRFILSAEKNDGTGKLSVKRNNALTPDTKYVYSALPQFVFSTSAFFLLWFFSLGLK